MSIQIPFILVFVLVSSMKISEKTLEYPNEIPCSQDGDILFDKSGTESICYHNFNNTGINNKRNLRGLCSGWWFNAHPIAVHDQDELDFVRDNVTYGALNPMWLGVVKYAFHGDDSDCTFSKNEDGSDNTFMSTLPKTCTSKYKFCYYWTNDTFEIEDTSCYDPQIALDRGCYYDIPLCNSKKGTDPSVCNSHGKCVDSEICLCDEYYTGKYCQIPEYDCGGVPWDNGDVCSKRGKCVSQDLCVCMDGFVGSTCQNNISGLCTLEYDYPFAQGAKYLCFSVDPIFEYPSFYFGEAKCNGTYLSDLFPVIPSLPESHLISIHDHEQFTALKNGAGTAVWLGLKKNGNSSLCPPDNGYIWMDSSDDGFALSMGRRVDCDGSGDCIRMIPVENENDYDCNAWDDNLLICQYDVPVCDGIPSFVSSACSGRGVCMDGDICHCSSLNGYSGLYCEDFYCNGIHFSRVHSTCSGHGECVGPSDCLCEEGYIGQDCEINTCFGKSKLSQHQENMPCSGHGECVEYDHCSCDWEYFGDECEHYGYPCQQAGDVLVMNQTRKYCYHYFSQSLETALPYFEIEDFCRNEWFYNATTFSIENEDEFNIMNNESRSRGYRQIRLGLLKIMIEDPPEYPLNITSSGMMWSDGSNISYIVNSGDYEFSSNERTRCLHFYGCFPNCRFNDGSCDMMINYDYMCRYPIHNCFGVWEHEKDKVCSGNGFCLSDNKCTCKDGYNGEQCENRTCSPDNVTFSVCSGKGSCDSITGCDCDEGYNGRYCENTECFSVYSNDSFSCGWTNGVCIDYNVCECEEYYFGEQCTDTFCNGIPSTDTDRVCSGRGFCGDYDSCMCDSFEYYGSFCQDAPCFGKMSTDDDVCSGRGVCSDIEVCTCYENYFGVECNVTLCDGGTIWSNDTANVCSGGQGTCWPFETCTCFDKEYFGRSGVCDTTTCYGIASDYEERVCSAHGSCVDHNVCQCDENYFGVECQVNICFGILSNESQVCSGYGDCVDLNHCVCDSNYWNENCSVTTCSDIFSNETSFTCSGKGSCWPFDFCHTCGRRRNVTIEETTRIQTVFLDRFDNLTFFEENWINEDGFYSYPVSGCGTLGPSLKLGDDIVDNPRQIRTKNFYIDDTVSSFKVSVSFDFMQSSCSMGHSPSEIKVFVDTSDEGSFLISEPLWNENTMVFGPEGGETPVLKKSTWFSVKIYQNSTGANGHIIFDDFMIVYDGPGWKTDTFYLFEEVCNSNGTCENDTCFCEDGFGGDICLNCSRECSVHGECEFRSGERILEDLEPYCDCDTNYTGPYCEFLEGCKHLSSCSGHGFCDDYICDCEIGWTNTPSDSCNKSHVCFDHDNSDVGVVCSGHGVCKSTDSCSCDPLYDGKYCNETTCFGISSLDESSVCSTHGKCHIYDTCGCFSDYYGSNCSVTTCNGVFSNDSQSMICSSHGLCRVHDACSCYNDYYGEYCNITTCSGIFSNETGSVCHGKGKCDPTDFCHTCNRRMTDKYVHNYFEQNLLFDDFNNRSFSESMWTQPLVLIPDCSTYGGVGDAMVVYSASGDCPRQVSTKLFILNMNGSRVNITFRPLCTCTLSQGGSPLNIMIDDNTGSPTLAMEITFGEVECSNAWETVMNVISPPIYTKEFRLVFYQDICDAGYDAFLFEDVNITEIYDDKSIVKMEEVCNSNGTCVDDECECFGGFDGEFCTECGLECGSHGECQFRKAKKWDRVESFCQCNNSNFTGPLCQYSKDCVHLGKCNNHGVCDDYLCECDLGWGQYDTCNVSFVCFEHDNTETGVVCGGHGVCEDFDVCKCDNDYFGDLICNLTICTMILSDDPDVCSTHGDCVSPNKCVCDENYFGEDCEVSRCYGLFSNESSVCSSYGRCVEFDKCRCYTDYHSRNCSVTSCSGIFSNDSSVCHGKGECWPFEFCHTCNRKSITVNETVEMQFFSDFENVTLEGAYWPYPAVTSACTASSGSRSIIMADTTDCPRYQLTNTFSISGPTLVEVSFKMKLCPVLPKCGGDTHVDVMLITEKEGIFLGELPIDMPTWDLYNFTVYLGDAEEFYLFFIQPDCADGCDLYAIDDVWMKWTTIFEDTGEEVCNSNGTCVDDECECFGGFDGDECLECKMACGSHGECQFRWNSEVLELESFCLCNDTNFTGPLCQYSKDCLHLGKCNNHGVCDDYLCECDLGWRQYDTCNVSYVCFEHDNTETGVVCGGHGVCEDFDVCKCDNDYFGDLICNITSCGAFQSDDSKVCSSHGNCVEFDICICDDGKYFGEECEVNYCQGVYSNESVVCSSHGECTDFDHCSCVEGYYSNNCSVTSCDGILSNDTSNVCHEKGVCWPKDFCQTCDRTIPYESFEVTDDFEITEQSDTIWEDLGVWGDVTDVCSSYSGTSALLIYSPTGECPRQAVTKEIYALGPSSVQVSYRIRNGVGECDHLGDGDAVVKVFLDTESQGSVLISEPNFTQSSWDPVLTSAPFFVNESSWVKVRFSQEICSCRVMDKYVIDDVVIAFSDVESFVCNQRGNCYNDTCKCLPDFSGEFCDSCAADCGSHGECRFVSKVSNETYCHCNDSSYTGPSCEYLKNCLHLDGCSGHGSCDDFLCICDIGWNKTEKCNESYVCEGLTNEESTCSAHGDCVGDEICVCVEGYYGANCNTSSCFGIAVGDPYLCSSHGRCVQLDVCQCQPNFYGKVCNVTQCNGVYSNETDGSICSSHGDCVDHDRCLCDENYYGDICKVTTCSGVYSNETGVVCNGKGECLSYDICDTCERKGPLYPGFDVLIDEFENATYSKENWVDVVDFSSSYPYSWGVVTPHCGSSSGFNAMKVFSPNNDGECPRKVSTRTFSLPSGRPSNVRISFRVKSGIGICSYVGENSVGLKVFVDTDREGSVLVSELDVVQPSWEPLHTYDVFLRKSREFSVRFSQLKCSCASCDLFVIDDVGIRVLDYQEVCNRNGICNENDTCSCFSGASGKYCSNFTEVLECFGISSNDSNVCSGHGDCLEDNNCTCTNNYTHSPSVERQTEDCSSWSCFGLWVDKEFNTDGEEPCNGNGECVSPDKCVCNKNYSGPSCSDYKCFGFEKADEDYVCSGHGTCVDLNECDCSEYSGTFSGERCHVWNCFGVSTDKKGEVCSGHGTCFDVDKCTCNYKYEQSYPPFGNCDIWYCGGLERNDTTVAEEICSGHGTCVSADFCSCKGGFFGSLCDRHKCGAIESTDPAVCSGRGDCIGPDTCICDSRNEEKFGFYGRDCEIRVGRSLVRTTKNAMLLLFEVKEDDLLEYYGLGINEEFDCSNLLSIGSSGLDSLFSNCSLSNMLEFTPLLGSTKYLKIHLEHLSENGKKVLFEKISGEYGDVVYVSVYGSDGTHRVDLYPPVSYIDENRKYTLRSFSESEDFVNQKKENKKIPFPESKICKTKLLIDDQCIEHYECFESVDDIDEFSYYSVGYVPSAFENGFFFSKIYYMDLESCERGISFKEFVFFSSVSCYGSPYGDSFFVYEGCSNDIGSMFFGSSALTYFILTSTPVYITLGLIAFVLFWCCLNCLMICCKKRLESCVKKYRRKNQMLEDLDNMELVEADSEMGAIARRKKHYPDRRVVYVDGNFYKIKLQKVHSTEVVEMDPPELEDQTLDQTEDDGEEEVEVELEDVELKEDGKIPDESEHSASEQSSSDDEEEGGEVIEDTPTESVKDEDEKKLVKREQEELFRRSMIRMEIEVEKWKKMYAINLDKYLKEKRKNEEKEEEEDDGDEEEGEEDTGEEEDEEKKEEDGETYKRIVSKIRTVLTSIKEGSDDVKRKYPLICCLRGCCCNFLKCGLMVGVILFKEGMNLWFSTSEFLDDSDIDTANKHFVFITAVIGFMNTLIWISIGLYLFTLFVMIILFVGRFWVDPFLFCIAYGSLKEYVFYRIFKSVAGEVKEIDEEDQSDDEKDELEEKEEVIEHAGEEGIAEKEKDDMFTEEFSPLAPSLVEEIKRIRDSDEYGHMAWELLDGLNDEEIEFLQKFFSHYVYEKETFETIFLHHRLCTWKWFCNFCFNPCIFFFSVVFPVVFRFVKEKVKEWKENEEERKRNLRRLVWSESDSSSDRSSETEEEEEDVDAVGSDVDEDSESDGEVHDDEVHDDEDDDDDDDGGGDEKSNGELDVFEGWVDEQEEDEEEEEEDGEEEEDEDE